MLNVERRWTEWNHRMSAWVDNVCEDVSISEPVLAGRLLELIEEFLTNISRANEPGRDTPDKAA
jgi:hypothetical protein